MAELIHTTTANFRGPWLLDKDTLLSLDATIEDVWKQLQKRKKADVTAATGAAVKKARAAPGFAALDEAKQKKTEEDARVAARSHFDYDPRFLDESRGVDLGVGGTEKVRVGSFREAMESPHCAGRTAEKAEISVECYGVSVIVAVPQREHEVLHIMVFPEDSPAAQDAFLRLRSWGEGNRPSWKRLTLGRAHVLAWAALAILFLAAFGFGTGMERRDNSKAEAARLLDAGLQPGDELKALHLMLAMQSGVTQATTLTVSPWACWLLASFTALAVALTFLRARTAFEIGRGAASVRRQAFWGKAATVTVPLFLFASFAVPLFRSALYDWAKRVWGW